MWAEGKQQILSLWFYELLTHAGGGMTIVWNMELYIVQLSHCLLLQSAAPGFYGVAQSVRNGAEASLEDGEFIHDLIRDGSIWFACMCV